MQMKRSPIRLSSSQCIEKRSQTAIPEVTIHDIPKEIYGEIFLNLGFDLNSFGTMRLVSGAYKGYIDAYCQSLVDTYFPYLRFEQSYINNPLGLVYQEFNYYKDRYPNIAISDILCALSGDSERIKSVQSEVNKATLYAMLLANGNKLDHIPENDKQFDLHIPSQLFAIYAGRGDIDFLNNYEGKLFVQAIGLALLNACSKGRIEVVKYLLNIFSSNNNRFKLSFETLDLMHAINAAAGAGYVDIVEFLFNQNMSDQLDPSEPFHKAASKGHLDVVDFFLNAAVDMQSKCQAFSQALKNGHLKVAEHLYKKINNDIEAIVVMMKEKGTYTEENDYSLRGARILYFNFKKSLHDAARNGHDNTVEYILANCHFEDYELDAPLNDAIGNGHLKVVKRLLPLCCQDKSMIFTAIKEGKVNRQPIVGKENMSEQKVPVVRR